MNDLKILNEGRKDLLNPLNEEEMNFLLGGLESSSSTIVSCKKGYSAMECKCGYQGPSFPQWSTSTQTQTQNQAPSPNS